MAEKKTVETKVADEDRRSRKQRLKEIELAREELDLKKDKLELRRLRVEVQNEEFKLSLEASKKVHQCTYVFNKTVSLASAEECRATLDQWHLLYPDAPFTIEFNSPGGEVFSGWGLYDTIRENSKRGHEITTIAFGWAASMAGMLLQAGDKRLMGRSSYMMLHEVSSGAIGKVSEIQDSVDLSQRLTEQMARFYSERSKKSAAKGKHLTTKQILAKTKKFDWWIGAEEALELGFLDGIVG